MKKELWISSLSLVFMSFFMIFSTVLYFSKSKQLNNAQVFNEEYSDMAFELVDSNMFVQKYEDDINEYEQKEIYKINLNIKYREKNDMNLKVHFNANDINLDDYKNILISYSIVNQYNQIVKEKTPMDLKNERITILDDFLTYSKTNYIYTINIEITDKYNDNNYHSNYDLITLLSADII